MQPGDEVILPAPYWVTYAEAIRMAGAVPVIVETSEETGFKMTAKMLENAITDKTKCLILTNPSNPTGMVYHREELTALAEVVVAHDIYVLSDEIYCGLVYQGEFGQLCRPGRGGQGTHDPRQWHVKILRYDRLADRLCCLQFGNRQGDE